MGKSESKVISLLSGGIDSSTATAIAKDKGYEIIAISFDYNQKHKIEIEYAKKICKFLNIKEHNVININIGQFGSSALTDMGINIPFRKIHHSPFTIHHSKIPITYVPMRNLVFLSIACSLAEAKNIRRIFFGANVIDYSGYPDCRPEFIQSFIKTANLGSKIFHTQDKSFIIETPLIKLTKMEIIKKGLSLGLDYSLTYSCYTGNKSHCGRCDSCQYRFKAFRDLGLKIQHIKSEGSKIRRF